MTQCRACGQEHRRGGNLCLDCCAAAFENDGDRYAWIGEEADQVRVWALEDMDREEADTWASRVDAAYDWDRDNGFYEDRALGGEPIQ